MAILLKCVSGTYLEIQPAGDTWQQEELEFFLEGHAESIGTLPAETGSRDQFLIFANQDRERDKLPVNHLATGYTGKKVRGHVIVVKQSEIEG